MARSTGFATGDFDTAFPLDEKFIALRSNTGANVYYSACGIWWHVVAAAWRTATLPDVHRVCPDADPDEVGALIRAGLLDTDGRLPATAFDSWPGAALERRRDNADRQARHRQSRAVTVSHDESPSVTRLARGTRQDRTGQDKSRQDTEGVQGEPLAELQRLEALEAAGGFQVSVQTKLEAVDVPNPNPSALGMQSDAFDAYWQLAGKYPAGKAASWLDELVEQYGDREVGSALAVAAMAEHSNGNLIGKAKDILARDARLAAKETAAADRERAQTALAKVEAMPAEQRAANLGRLAQMFRDAGKTVVDPEEVLP